MEERAQITANIERGCFCKFPDLPPGQIVPYYPRFEFVKAVKDYAKKHNLEIYWINGKSGNRAAFTFIKIPCQHRDKQSVRISFKLV